MPQPQHQPVGPTVDGRGDSEAHRTVGVGPAACDSELCHRVAGTPDGDLVIRHGAESGAGDESDRTGALAHTQRCRPQLRGGSRRQRRTGSAVLVSCCCGRRRAHRHKDRGQHGQRGANGDLRPPAPPRAWRICTLKWAAHRAREACRIVLAARPPKVSLESRGEPMAPGGGADAGQNTDADYRRIPNYSWIPVSISCEALPQRRPRRTRVVFDGT